MSVVADAGWHHDGPEKIAFDQAFTHNFVSFHYLCNQ